MGYLIALLVLLPVAAGVIQFGMVRTFGDTLRAVGGNRWASYLTHLDRVEERQRPPHQRTVLCLTTMTTDPLTRPRRNRPHHNSHRPLGVGGAAGTARLRHVESIIAASSSYQALAEGHGEAPVRRAEKRDESDDDSSTESVDILKRHEARQRRERFKGAASQPPNLVFTSSIGSALDDRNVRRAFKQVLVTAKLPSMRIHDLRHTCATLLLAQGVHPKAVQSILGHSQISLTMEHVFDAAAIGES